MAAPVSHFVAIIPNVGVDAGIRTLSPWEDGKPPYSFYNKFRLTFAGHAVSSVCQAWSAFSSTKAAAGQSIDGTYDFGGTTSLVPSLSIAFTNHADGTCTSGIGGSSTSQTIRLDCWADSIGFEGKVRVYAVVAGTTHGNLILFDAVIDRCDFREGVVVNNFITAAGLYTDTGGVPSQKAIGYGGTCTITRLCCDCP